MKIQSLYTTQKNLGIPSPKEEQKIQVREWENMSLAIEISRSPEMRMKIQGMMAEEAKRQGAGEGPQLTEGEGGAGHESGEELPMSAPKTPQQAPTSAEGAIAEKGFRGT